MNKDADIRENVLSTIAGGKQGSTWMQSRPFILLLLLTGARVLFQLVFSNPGTFTCIWGDFIKLCAIIVSDLKIFENVLQNTAVGMKWMNSYKQSC